MWRGSRPFLAQEWRILPFVRIAALGIVVGSLLALDACNGSDRSPGINSSINEGGLGGSAAEIGASAGASGFAGGSGSPAAASGGGSGEGDTGGALPLQGWGRDNEPGVHSADSYVVVVSVDGLAPRFLDELLAQDQLPTFAALQKRAAWTHNARTTPGSTLTFPNHFSMLSSRPATDGDQFSPGRAHGLLFNLVLPDDETIHTHGADSYVPSIFDVVHDHGGRTGLFASKEKFRAFADGYGPVLGVPDPYPKDFGRNKVDVVSVVDEQQASEVVGAFIAEAKASPLNFSILHLRDTDSAGHLYSWGSPQYLDALRAIDQALGALFSFLDSASPYKDKVHVLITTDHGGVNRHHQDLNNPLNFTIPLYLVSPTIRGSSDFYALARHFRSPPPANQYALENAAPPIRNTDVGNLSATLLGLPEIPNSTVRSFHHHGHWSLGSGSCSSAASTGKPNASLMDKYVILVSLDGLAPRLIEKLGAEGQLPTLTALQKRAAWTHSARTTPGSTLAFPNHFSMLTSRPATDDVWFSPGRAHGLLFDSVLPEGETIHSQGTDSYVPSVFDVVHDNGGRTGLFASEKKFRAFADGYGPTLGVPDPYPKDFGRNKVDLVSVIEGAQASEVVAAFIAGAEASPLNFSFLHLRQTDSAGHVPPWESPPHLDALRAMDRSLGTLFSFLDSTAPYQDKVHVMITADHGGGGTRPGDTTDPLNFTIPLYLVGPTIRESADLYALAGHFRARPPADQYALQNSAPPIRSTDIGNLSATLLGLPEIPNSTVRSFHFNGCWPLQGPLRGGD